MTTTALLANLFAVVDVETTGLSLRRDEIIEICIVRVQNGCILSSWDSLVRPSKPVPLSATRLHGIDNDMLMLAPTKTAVAREAEELLRGTVFVEHSLNGFDSNFVAEFLGRRPWAAELSTISLAKVVLPNLDGYGLEPLCAIFSIALIRHHAAKEDANATAALLIALVARQAALPPGRAEAERARLLRRVTQ